MAEAENLSTELLGAILQEIVDQSALLSVITEQLAKNKGLDKVAKGILEQLAQDREKRNLRIRGLIRRATPPKPK